MAFNYISDNYSLILNFCIICLPTYYITAYMFCKIQDIRLSKSQIVYVILSGFLLTVLFVLVRFYNPPLSHALLFFMISVLLSVLIRDRVKFFKALTIGLVSTAQITVLEVISILIQGSMEWFFHIVSSEIASILLTKIITLLLCMLFLNIKRFRKGFQFFQDENNLGMGLALSQIVMILRCINLRDSNDRFFISIIFVIGIIIAGFGLYLWIRRSITAHYRERLQLKSEEHYKEVLEERDKEIEKLNQSNAYLAKIVHRDNHLMSNVNTSIDMYFNSDDNAYKENLLHELQTLAKERSETINKEQLESKLLPSTGNLLIDGAINDLYIKAAAHGIDFNLTVSSTVDKIIGKYISQTDLQTLLCDHIKDAIIAVDSYGESGGKILINLSKQNDNYCIDIYDSGVAFEPDTLSKLGMERVTTHADSGGSGIGFMTTFETIRKAYASLIITEFEHRSPFSKSVSFRFDGESAFIINSYRKDELQQLITRNDVIYL